MFLEFWPNRFIKIAVDENVFFSVNSREIGGNTRFGYELAVFEGYMTRFRLGGYPKRLIYLIGLH